MPGKKTPDQLRKESRRLKVAEYMMRGISNQSELASLVGWSVPTICKDMKAIRQQWRVDMVAAFEYAKEEQIKKLEAVERQAWRGWTRSQRPSTKIVRRMSKDGVEVSETTEGREGNPRFLEIVEKCIESRRKLMGLDEPERIDLRGSFTVAAASLQRVIEDNGEYIEFKRQQLLSRGSTFPSISSDVDQQGEVVAGKTFDLAGYPAGANGNGKAAARKPAVSRIRYRLDGNGDGQAD
ncbi:MAG: hypothetical protein WC378_00120 [Opitutaceae bacterium]|jgi:hypothetical protein